MDDYESRVSKLQQWMTDTKQMTMPGDSAPLTMTMADRSQLHQVSPVLHLLTIFFLFCTCLSKFYMTFKKAVVAAVMVCSTRLEEEVALTLVHNLWLFSISVGLSLLHFTFYFYNTNTSNPIWYRYIEACLSEGSHFQMHWWLEWPGLWHKRGRERGRERERWFIFQLWFIYQFSVLLFLTHESRYFIESWVRILPSVSEEICL